MLVCEGEGSTHTACINDDDDHNDNNDRITSMIIIMSGDGKSN